MKPKYKQLLLPKDSAWGRKTIWKYIPNFIIQFIEGVENIIKWIPTIYKDKNWDKHFIFEIIKFKLLQQKRASLVRFR